MSHGRRFYLWNGYIGLASVLMNLLHFSGSSMFPELVLQVLFLLFLFQSLEIEGLSKRKKHSGRNWKFRQTFRSRVVLHFLNWEVILSI